MVNYGLPAAQFLWLMFTHPKSTVHTILDKFRLWLRISAQRIKTSTIGNRLIDCHAFHAKQKMGELWSINHKVVFAYFGLPKIDSARVFGQPQTLIAHISEMHRDIDKWKMVFSTVIYSTLDGKIGWTLVPFHKKVLLSHLNSPKFNSALAM